MKVPLAMQGLDDAEIELVCEVFRSGQLTMGQRVEDFEAFFARRNAVRYAVMVNSGSSANLLAFESLVRSSSPKAKSWTNDQIIAVPAVMWPTSLWPIIQLGFRALIVDTKPNSLEMDFQQLRSAKKEYGDKLVGAVLIHPLGKSLDLAEIEDLKTETGMWILEDNCESLGAGNNGHYAGTVGDLGTFSFYFSHHITTVEGGMVVTNDQRIAEDLRSMRAHGWTRNRQDKSSWETENPELPTDFLFVTSGYNFRPMEFQGALGTSQLLKLDNFIVRRIRNAQIVSDSIEGTNLKLIGSEVFRNQPDVLKEVRTIPEHSWMALPLLWSGDSFSIRELTRRLNENGIATRPLLAGDFTNQPAGAHPSILKYGDLSNSKSIYQNGFMLGNHHEFTDEQISWITTNLSKLARALK